MKLNKSQGDLLKRVIERWEADGTIDVSTADRLKESYTVRSFEWKELAMVGSARFELTNAGVKVPCLTTWRRPIIKEKAVQEPAS